MWNVNRRSYEVCLYALVLGVAYYHCTSCGAVVSIGVAPPIVELTVPAGGAHVVDLNVYNQGDSPLILRGYVTGLELSRDGAPIPLETGDGDWSCADWIRLDKKEFELQAGEEELVHATLRVPRGSTGGRYAVIFFEGTPVLKNPSPWDVVLATRVGCIVMETIPRTLVRDGEILKMEVSKSEGEVVFTVDFSNKGNVHMKANGCVLIADSEGRIVDRVPLDVVTGTVLPGGIREFEGTWSNRRKMKTGEYTGEVRIAYGGHRGVLRMVTFRLEGE
ncbi:hypothetical protein AMJ40_06130 [candidate division TA06 bacterium DG_26]|uniref:Uncharacterized protein n=1 Tax=candidate division TA06 bacterium DG_26 TaxID=1703771 RepID=A0A0S7WG80_UNCT6|nr:MAG: hypothetical protein AMJ40_06130 [candidate division TA06 bacterium DG_26]